MSLGLLVAGAASFACGATDDRASQQPDAAADSPVAPVDAAADATTAADAATHADAAADAATDATSLGSIVRRAGTLGGPGNADGIGAAARFNLAQGVAVDSAGNVFVADTSNETIRKVTPAGVVTTIAGASALSGVADGAGASARFSDPLGLAVDAAGNVFVADTSNHTIRKISAAGVVTTLAGAAGSSGFADGAGTVARFNSPAGVAVDSAGNVFVADTSNHTIRQITSVGVVTTLAGTAGSSGIADGSGPTARFNAPSAIAVAGAGDIFVADTSNTIRQVTHGGVVTTLAGSPGAPGSTDGTGSGARFEYPSGVAVDGAGNVFVGDTANRTLRKITSSGTVTTLAGKAGSAGSADGTGAAASFIQPEGVAVDTAGNVFVADALNCAIRKVSSAGVVTTLAGTAATAGFDRHSAVAMDGAGNMLVAEPYIVRRVSSAGVVSNLAGNAGLPGSADGTGVDARFNYLSGIAVDAAGNAFVTDTHNHTVRKVTPAGVVTTLAGAAGMPGSDDGTGASARFTGPEGITTDAVGNVFVTSFNSVRKISAAGVVTTLAGADPPGSLDGAGAAARFNQPRGVAVDTAGNVFVADMTNHLLRKITPAGVVTTMAGAPGIPGSADGVGGAARFSGPAHVAVDGTGNVFVSDTQNFTLRKVTASGVVTTLAGVVGSGGVQLGPLPGSLNAVGGLGATPTGGLVITSEKAVLEVILR